VTIVTSVKVRDGLILGTDSMTQIVQGGQLLKTYSNARKLFRITDTIGAMTWGLGNVGNRSIEGIVLDFVKTQHGESPVQDVARQLYDHVKVQYEAVFADVPADQRPALGFFIAGYSPGQAFPDEFEFLIPRDDAPFAARPADTFGASWRGVDAPITRLYKGFDPYVIPARLQAKGMSQQDIDEVLDAQGLETGIMIDGMPVQDAINFAVYILEAAIGWAMFAVGAASCGGPLQVATILADAGFAWVARPEPAVQPWPLGA
jgi:hypothetical protein